MRIFATPAALRDAVDQSLGFSSWQEVDGRRIAAFARATGDHQWIHVDPERAEHGPFGTIVAHGYLTLAMIPAMLGELYRVDGTRMAVNYGLNRVRFPAPVPAGSRVRAGVVIRSATDVPVGVQVVAEVTVEVEGGAKPCCVAETVTRYFDEEPSAT